MDYRAAAREFVHDNFCFIDVSAEQVAEANDCFTQLFTDLVPDSTLHGTRDGETEPDVGLIRKTKTKDGVGDEKWYFHVAADMQLWLPESVRRGLGGHKEQLRKLLYFHRDIRNLILNLTDELEEELKLQSGALSGALRHCSKNSMRYCVNTIRGLFYETQPNQTGARAHIDRSLITGHLGDIGGALEAEIAGNWEPVSPLQGKMLVFAGAKMLWLTEGRIGPLVHRSTVEPGVDRRAMVFFGQADVGYYPDRAQEIVDEFYRRHPSL